jgi:hypothetical protein
VFFWNVSPLCKALFWVTMLDRQRTELLAGAVVSCCVGWTLNTYYLVPLEMCKMVAVSRSWLFTLSVSCQEWTVIRMLRTYFPSWAQGFWLTFCPIHLLIPYIHHVPIIFSLVLGPGLTVMPLHIEDLAKTTYFLE